MASVEIALVSGLKVTRVLMCLYDLEWSRK